jgi:hypothetical protein
VQAYLYTMQKYGPEMAKKLGWGGHFGTDIHSWRRSRHHAL